MESDCINFKEANAFKLYYEPDTVVKYSSRLPSSHLCDNPMMCGHGCFIVYKGNKCLEVRELGLGHFK